MQLIGWFLQNPVKVAVGVILLVLFGTLALFSLPMQMSPDVTRPQISISTNWPGASPHEIENEIINPQEEKLKSVEGVTRMMAECLNGTGDLTLEFRVGTNLNEALLKVNSQLQQVREYPLDADKPVIRTSSPFDRAIAWLILGPVPPNAGQWDSFIAAHPELKEELEHARRPTSPGLQLFRLRELAAVHPEVEQLLPKRLELSEYRKFAEDVIETQLERVPGVADAFVRGGRLPQLHVVVDAAKLAARGLTLADLRSAFLQNNADVSAGDYADGKSQIGVRVIGQYRSPDEVANQIIGTSNGVSVYVRDVAEVRMGFEKNTGFVRRYGDSSISLNVQRETSANVVDVMRMLRTEVDRLNRGVLAQNGLTLTQVYDETVYINSAVNLVRENIILGGALTVVVLMLFLHLGIRSLAVAPLILATALLAIYLDPWYFVATLALVLGAGFWFARGTLVIAIAIPISIIGTFLFLAAFGRTLNVVSLAGMSFAVGMLVDNAIVVLENIVRYQELGYSPARACRQAAGEVWGAVLASTLTTLAVFLPVIFLEGEVGQLFGDIALAISVAVGLSLVVSVTVVPTAAARILSARREEQRKAVAPDPARQARLQAGPAARLLQAAGQGVVSLVGTTNHWVQRSVWHSLVATLLMLVPLAAAGWWLFPKVEYLPSGNRNLVICNIITPPGYNIDHLNAIGIEVEKILQPYWNIDPEHEDVSGLDYPSISDFFYVARERSVFMGLSSHDPMRVRELIDLIQAKLKNRFPGTIVSASQTSLFGRGMAGGRDIDVEISGPELERLVALGSEIMGRIKAVFPESTQVRPTPGLDLSTPELHVELKPEQASAAGITSDELGYVVNALVDGAYAADYTVSGEKIDLVIRGTDDDLRRDSDLLGRYVATRNLPEPVRLDSIATARLSSGPEAIHHRERQRTITLELSPPPELSLEEAIDRIRTSVIQPLEESGQLGSNYLVHLSGSADKLAQTWEALKWNFLLAVLITYLLMAALFESWIYPFIIMFSVPLGAVGGIFGLQLLSRYLVLIGEPPQSLDVLTMLGFVILVGTVVNNAILIVHQALVFEREGMEPQACIRESVRTRIRPIFMTTLTTVFGLAPLVLFPGAGSELYRGLGSVVLGGLVLSTVLSLVLIPTLMSLLARVRQWLGWSSTDSHPRREEWDQEPAAGLETAGAGQSGKGSAALEPTSAGAGALRRRSGGQEQLPGTSPVI